VIPRSGCRSRRWFHGDPAGSGVQAEDEGRRRPAAVGIPVPAGGAAPLGRRSAASQAGRRRRRRFARRWSGSARAGAGKPGGRAGTITLAELVEEYLELHQAEPVTIAKLRWLLGKATAVLGEKRLADLSRNGGSPRQTPCLPWMRVRQPSRRLRLLPCRACVVPRQGAGRLNCVKGTLWLVQGCGSLRGSRRASAFRLAFAANARWQREPSGLLAAGSDIIDNTNGLEQHFLPLLMSH
jgi:hypothetical protein